jgi:hypothetical protein
MEKTIGVDYATLEFLAHTDLKLFVEDWLCYSDVVLP